MDSITSREFLLRISILEVEQETPSRQDWYLMQIAREVHLVLANAESRKKTQLSTFRLSFEKKTKQPQPVDSKSIWLGAVGVKQWKKKSDD